MLIRQSRTGISKAKISANYIFNLRKRVAEDEAAAADNNKDVPDTAPSFKFDNVSFAYERRPMHQVLKNINLQVRIWRLTPLPLRVTLASEAEESLTRPLASVI